MEAVVEWVLGHDLEPAGILLEDERCSRLAFNTLLGLHNTEDRERSSIFSAAADALQPYTSETALKAARDPNFDPAGFVRSADTIYIHAPAEEQAAVAPIVCGLLAEIRRQTYRAHNTGQLAGGGMLFALDEVANIAPLGGAAADRLRRRRPRPHPVGSLAGPLPSPTALGSAQADGFLTLFGTKLILPGIADTRTLDAISTMLGEYDRQSRVPDTHHPQPAQHPRQKQHRHSTRHDRLHPTHPPPVPRGDREHPHRMRAAPRRRPMGTRDAHPSAPRRTVADAHHRARPRDELAAPRARPSATLGTGFGSLGRLGTSWPPSTQCVECVSVVRRAAGVRTGAAGC